MESAPGARGHAVCIADMSRCNVQVENIAKNVFNAISPSLNKIVDCAPFNMIECFGRFMGRQVRS